MAIKMLVEKYSNGSFAREVTISNLSSPLGEMVALADKDYVYLLQFDDGRQDLDVKVTGQTWLLPRVFFIRRRREGGADPVRHNEARLRALRNARTAGLHAHPEAPEIRRFQVQRVYSALNFKLSKGSNKLLDLLQNELEQYFDGNLKQFTVPIQSFGPQFHKEVWNELINIPFGTTKSYSDHARALGHASGHARAVGAACGANPHVILVPCHRIVAQGGKGGYSAGGERKDWLLAHEEKYAR